MRDADKQEAGGRMPGKYYKGKDSRSAVGLLGQMGEII